MLKQIARIEADHVKAIYGKREEQQEEIGFTPLPPVG
jgi:hypothetical protein